MERIYTYDPKRYNYQILLTGYIMIALTIYSGVKLFTSFNGLWIMVFAVALYGALNTFVLRAYPQKIKVTDTELSFYARGVWKSFTISEISTMAVRTQPGGFEMLVRIEDKQGRKGKFWVTIARFSDREDLAVEIYHILKLISPRDIVFSGNNRMYDSRPGQEDASAYTEADFMGDE